MASLSMGEGGVELRRGVRGGSIRGSSGALFIGDDGGGAGERTTGGTGGGSTTPVPGSSTPGTNTHHHQPLSTQSYLTLRSITNHRRVVSESSHEEKNTRNSLKGFLSSSYDQAHHLTLNLLEVRAMVRSPSGCSEVSSVRSGVRSSGVNKMGYGAPAQHHHHHHHHHYQQQHQSGRCYLGLALPLDLDCLLYDATMDKGAHQGAGGLITRQLVDGAAKERFSPITESELESSIEEKSCGTKKWMCQKPSPVSEKSEGSGKGGEDNGLELHGKDMCLACFTTAPPSPPPPPPPLSSSSASHSPAHHTDGGGGGEGEGGGVVVIESPPLQRVKVTNEVTETSESSSVNSQGWDDLGEGKPGPERGVNQTLLRKEVLRFISNLLSSIAARSSEAGLLTLKQRWPQSFCDLCLYSEICLILASYNYRLTSRRFVQELFMDLVFTEVYTEAGRILKTQPAGVYETVNPLVVQESLASSTITCFSLHPPSMADIAEVTLSDKSDREEDC